tara:strand:- start:106 stop:1125 length:1020 start_codon:yes stop_codon:yes gene_type:complete
VNQIKWKYINSCSFELLRADFMRTLWNEEVKNPAYTDEDHDQEEIDVPDNVNYSYSRSTLTFGIDYRRGISGFIFENLNFNDRKSMQAVFWERVCDLLDYVHTFTIGYNNDYWHEYPDFEDDVDENIQDKAYDDYYEKRNDDIVELEDDIIELARKVSKSNNESDKFCFKRVVQFIDAKESYVNVEWADIKNWDDAKKTLLKQLELFFEAVGPDPFLISYIDNYLPKQQQQHFDWRLNPLLRDIFLGYLTRNPILLDLNGKLIKDSQIFDLLFNEPKNSFYDSVKPNNYNVGDVIICENYDELVEEKYKVSLMSDNGLSYKETLSFWKESLGTYYVQSD